MKFLQLNPCYWQSDQHLAYAKPIDFLKQSFRKKHIRTVNGNALFADK